MTNSDAPATRQDIENVQTTLNKNINDVPRSKKILMVFKPRLKKTLMTRRPQSKKTLTMC
ncbi:MAG: hypothetical protein ACREGA_01810 [Candidatus Saccharimonadales bacterium]